MKKVCSWSKSYKEMLGVVLNVEKGWTGKKNLDRMELGNEVIWRITELYKWVLDGVDWDEYENGFSEEWDVAIGIKVACMLEEED